MTLSSPRKVMLYVIQIGIQVLWVLDRITNFDLKDSFWFLKRLFVVVTSFSFVIFLGYSYGTGYLNKVAEGVFLSSISNPITQHISGLIITKSLPKPEVTAKSVLAIERSRNKVLFEKDSNTKMVPASTVKLMTAAVSLDIYKDDELLKVPRICTLVEGSKAFLPSNFEFKVRDLIYVMLIGSSADAACVLSQGKVTEAEFVDLMNKKAKEYEMNSTHFSNSIGLDNVNGGHYSTASDLYKLVTKVLDDPLIQDAVKERYYLLSSIDSRFLINISNTNRLLWEIPDSVGIKTGTTTGAGEVLIYEYKNDKKDIIIVVMGSKDRFGDTKVILDWILNSYSWE